MKTTIKTRKIEVARKQIEVLEAKLREINAENYNEAKVEGINDQIIALYEEIDWLEGETVEGTENTYHKRSDEIEVTPTELLMVASLGWTREDLIKQKMRKARRVG